MPRARSPNRALALRLWLESGGKRELKDIAAQIGVSPELVRKWKHTDRWNAESEKVTLPNDNEKINSNVTKRETKRKRGGQPGNKNAVGNPGGGAPVGNTNALVHGGYSPVYWDTLTDEEKALLSNSDKDSETLLLEEINLLSIRERRIMLRIQKLTGLDERAKGGMGQAVASVIRSEDKREFDAPEDKELYDIRQRAKIESGDILPGRKYKLMTRTEPTYDIIHRLEEALTRCQAQKQRCIQTLVNLRVKQNDGAKGEISADTRREVEEMIRQIGIETGRGDSSPADSSG